MKILVVEDKEMHRQSARETLAGHEVTIHSSFDQAIDAMKVEIDEENVQKVLTEAGFSRKPEQEDTQEYRKAYWKAHSEAEKASVIPFPFETVLVDMMMPMSRRTLASDAYNWGEEVPYGFVLALRAALRGARFIAVVTDTNHHKGAMSAALDHLGFAYYRSMRPNFTINGAKCLFIHTPFVKDLVKDAPCYSCRENPGVCGCCRGTGTGYITHKPCHMCTDGKCTHCKGTGKADTTVEERKDWGQVLRDLTSEALPDSEE